MRNKKTASSIIAVLVVLSLMGWLVGCNKDEITVQGVNYGQYGNMWAHGLVRIDGSLDVDSTTNLDDLDIDASGEIEIDGGLVDIGGGTGGTADGDNDLLVAADLEVDGILDVDGSVDVDGTAMAVDLSGALSLDAGTASNITLATQDLTIEAATGSIIIKGDEAAADGVYIDANDAVTTGLTIIVGSASGLSIDGGMTDIGGCTAGTADGDNDLCVAAVLEVDGATDLDGTLAVAGVATFAALANLSFANETITDGEVLVPTVNVYSLDTGGAVTMTLGITGAVEGQLLILINDDANALIIDDSDISTSDGGAITLAGAEDCVVFIFQDVTWHELLTIADS